MTENNIAAGTDAGMIGAFCVACKPGFTPSYGETLTFLVHTCTAITNCGTDKGTWLNSCSTCVFEFDICTGLVDFTTCADNNEGVTKTYPNCLAADSVNSECKLCKKGYSLSGGLCERIAVPKCTEVIYT